MSCTLPRSPIRWPLPAEQRQELGKRHRRGAPNLNSLGDEGWCFERAPIVHQRPGAVTGRIQQRLDGDLEDARHFAEGGAQHGTSVDGRHDGMQAEATDGDVEGRKRADRVHGTGVEANFLVRLAERCVFDAFAWFDAAARHGDLAAMPLKGVRANGEHHMGAILEREEQQESSRVAEILGLETLRPIPPRPRGQHVLCGGAGQGGHEGRLDGRNSGVKDQRPGRASAVHRQKIPAGARQGPHQAQNGPFSMSIRNFGANRALSEKVQREWLICGTS